MAPVMPCSASAWAAPLPGRYDRKVGDDRSRSTDRWFSHESDGSGRCGGHVGPAYNTPSRSSSSSSAGAVPDLGQHLAVVLAVQRGGPTHDVDAGRRASERRGDAVATAMRVLGDRQVDHQLVHGADPSVWDIGRSEHVEPLIGGALQEDLRHLAVQRSPVLHPRPAGQDPRVADQFVTPPESEDRLVVPLVVGQHVDHSVGGGVRTPLGREDP